MWQKLSLRGRLNTLLALVMVLGLVINIARLLLEAAPRVTAEDQSVVRLARGFVETLVSDLNDASEPEVRLDQIVEGLKRLRRVSFAAKFSAGCTSNMSGFDLRQAKATAFERDCGSTAPAFERSAGSLTAPGADSVRSRSWHRSG